MMLGSIIRFNCVMSVFLGLVLVYFMGALGWFQSIHGLFLGLPMDGFNLFKTCCELDHFIITP